MAMKTDQIKLPVSVATEIVNKAKDTSTIASLSPSTPQIFSDADYHVFNGKSEAEARRQPGAGWQSHRHRALPQRHRFRRFVGMAAH